MWFSCQICRREVWWPTFEVSRLPVVGFYRNRSVRHLARLGDPAPQQILSAWNVYFDITLNQPLDLGTSPFEISSLIKLGPNMERYGIWIKTFKVTWDNILKKLLNDATIPFFLLKQVRLWCTPFQLAVCVFWFALVFKKKACKDVIFIYKIFRHNERIDIPWYVSFKENIIDMARLLIIESFCKAMTLKTIRNDGLGYIKMYHQFWRRV